jgi:hypothetical protein
MLVCIVCPSSEIVDLHAHQWEIELGYQEVKQHILVGITNRFIESVR